MQSAVNELLTPRVIAVNAIDSTRAKVTLEPLERGFGHTLGNALRRILLSSMPGCAVTEAEIDNTLNWHAGIDVDDEDDDNSTTDMRYDVFGDPLHSKPLVVNYGTSIRIVIGTNAGVLHMFEDNTKTDVVTESWAFLPKEFLSKRNKRRIGILCYSI